MNFFKSSNRLFSALVLLVSLCLLITAWNNASSHSSLVSEPIVLSDKYLTLFQTVQAAFQKNHWAEAETASLALIEELKRTTPHPSFFDFMAHFFLAQSYFQQGHVKKGNETLQQALQSISNDHENRVLFLMTTDTQGFLLQQQEQDEPAIHAYQEALKALNSLKPLTLDPAELIMLNSWLNLPPKTPAKEALQISQGKILLQIGKSYYFLQNHQKAEQFLNQAQQELLPYLAQQKQVGVTLYTYLGLNQYPENLPGAKSYFKKALRLNTLSPSPTSQLLLLRYLAKVEERLGNLQATQTQYKSILSQFEEGHFHDLLTYNEVLTDYAAWYRTRNRAGDLEQANYLVSKALQVLSNLQGSSSEAKEHLMHTYFEQFQIARLQGNSQAQKTACKNALQLAQDIFNGHYPSKVALKVSNCQSNLQPK